MQELTKPALARMDAGFAAYPRVLRTLRRATSGEGARSGSGPD